MLAKSILYVSKRSQRWLVAMLGLILIHTVALAASPETPNSSGVHIQVNR
jgi:hypothetical protein